MSRAMNLNLTRDEVMAAAKTHGAVISAIESLRPAGTRVVLTTADKAAVMRRKLKTRLINTAVTRSPLRAR